MKKKLSIIALCLILTAPLGCKKDDDSTTPSLTGLSLNSAKPYIAVGEELSFTANTDNLTTSDESDPGAIGIYWQVNSENKDTLTRNIQLSNPDYHYYFSAAGSYSICCYAFCEKGYYTASAYTTTKVVDPLTAITGLVGNRPAGSAYRMCQLGNLLWMAENLYEAGSGASYLDSPVVDSVLGRYYSWEEAQSACPEGWRLPTAAEWDALGEEAGPLMADAAFMDETMWSYSPMVNITNSLRFNAIPAGYQDQNAGEYAQSGFGEYAMFWTADEENGQGVYRYIFREQPQVQKGKGDKSTLALSVRCVK